MNRVKKKPTTIVPATLRISALDPRLSANGNVTRLGTKNTGSHFAKRPAPGASSPYRNSPHSSFTALTTRRVVNNAPHPARDDGNEMERDFRSRRKATSIRMREEVDDIVAIPLARGDRAVLSLLSLLLLLVAVLIRR